MDWETNLIGIYILHPCNDVFSDEQSQLPGRMDFYRGTLLGKEWEGCVHGDVDELSQFY